jgi:hypothetical protein
VRRVIVDGHTELGHPMFLTFVVMQLVAWLAQGWGAAWEDVEMRPVLLYYEQSMLA